MSTKERMSSTMKMLLYRVFSDLSAVFLNILNKHLIFFCYEMLVP